MKILVSSLFMKRNTANSMNVSSSILGKTTSKRHSNKNLNKKNITNMSIKGKTGNSLVTNNNLTSVSEIEIEENLPMVIEKNQNIKFNVSFTPVCLGLFKSSVVFSPEDGIPFSVDLVANVKGPKIKLDTPCLDFGLFPISQIRILKFKIINTSPIPAKFLIKQNKYKNVNFSNYMDHGYIDDAEGVITEPKFRKKIESLIDYENRGMIKKDFKKMDLYDLKFSHVVGNLDPKEEREISVTFLSPYPKKLEETVEIMIENSESFFVNLHADCQEASAYLDMTVIQPKDIFVSVPINYNNNKFKLVNPSNLPIKFKWEEVNKSDELKVSFKPNEGVVPPRSAQEIRFSAVFHEIRKVDDLFKCFIEELEVPLGVVIKGKVIGLDILYEITDDTMAHMLFSGKQTDTLSVRSSNSARSTRRKSPIYGKKEEKLDKTLKSIDLKNVKVNKPFYFSFLVKNLSGIHTSFRIYSKNYGPVQEKESNKNEYSLMNSFLNTDKTHKSSSRTSVSNTYRKSVMTRGKVNSLDHNLLSDAHEEVNFTSAKGYEFTKLKQIEKDSEFYLGNKKGVAIVVEPRAGKLDPHSEVMIKVSIFNECVGDFDDELICEIKGLPPTTFPISLRIRGNPLQLSPFQPGINYNVDPPVMKLGSVITKVNKIEKIFKLLNTGSNLLSVEWKVYDYEDILYPKRDIFNIQISQTRKNKAFSLVYNPVEPKEFPEDKKYFEIFPKTCLINPKAIRDFIITFHTDIPGVNSALVVGYPKFEDGYNSLVKLSELALKVDAYGVIPNLVVDKQKTFDGKQLYKFYVHSAGSSPTPKKSIVLINKEKINFIVKTVVEGPFKIIKAEPMEATVGLNEYNIIPSSNLKLDVKFLAPNPEDESEWPMTLVNEKNGVLKIIFENGDTCEYLLTAILRRPKLTLSVTGNESLESPNFVNFGFVNCESQRKHALFLTNETEVETKWTINYIKFSPKKVYGHGTITKEEKEDMEKTDDPEVFHFSITQGFIPGPSHQLTNIPLGPALPQVYNEKSMKLQPVKIEVLFKPKKNVFYKSRYRIIAETGNQIDFILKGNGSYLEEHI